MNYPHRLPLLALLLAPAPAAAQELPPGALVRLGETRFRHPGASPVAWSPDGKVFASGGNEVRLWDVAAGKELRRFDVPGTARRMAFLPPKGAVLVTLGHDSVVRFWDVAAGKELRRLDTPGKGPGDGVEAFALSPDGKFLATGNWN